MKNKTNKRAFTIVELVIVIAVIAILAAVLIPTFSNLVKKAQVSSDTQLVRNLNTSLKTDEALNGKHNTMQEALDAVYESGFDLAKIMNTKATENTILWDSKNDVFCYLNGDEVVYLPESTTGNKLNNGDYQLWKIYSSDELATVQETTEKYSAYLTGEGWESEITVNGKGLDVGNVTGITTVNYNSESSNEVTIRTNSFDTVLNVTAEFATVRHFDKAKLVNIIKVAGHSYHEHGEVQGNIELNNGRVVMESGSKSAAIKVTATAADIESGAVTISVDNTASSEVAVVVSQEVKTAIANKGGNNKITAKEEQIITDSTVIDNFNKFAGGLGTETSPYLIENSTQLKEINTIIVSNYQTKTSYFKLIDNINVLGSDLTFNDVGDGFVIMNFLNAEINGNGHRIVLDGTNTIDNWIYLFYKTLNAKIQNIEFELKYSNAPLIYKAYDNTMFINADTYGLLKVYNNMAAYVQFAYGSCTFNNCTNYANLLGEGAPGKYNGIFIGYCFDDVQTFINCVNKGSIICGKATMFVGNVNNSYRATLIITNCFNEGLIQWCDIDNSNGSKPYGRYNQILAGSSQCIGKVVLDGREYTDNDQIRNLNVPTRSNGAFVWGPNDNQLALHDNNDGTFTITASSQQDVTYYKVVINVYCTPNEGGSLQQSIEFVVNSSEFVDGKAIIQAKDLNFVDQYWVESHPNAVRGELGGKIIYTLNEVSYYYLELVDAKFTGNGIGRRSSITVSAYDENNVPKATAAIK